MEPTRPPAPEARRRQRRAWRGVALVAVASVALFAALVRGPLAALWNGVPAAVQWVRDDAAALESGIGFQALRTWADGARERERAGTLPTTGPGPYLYAEGSIVDPGEVPAALHGVFGLGRDGPVCLILPGPGGDPEAVVLHGHLRGALVVDPGTPFPAPAAVFHVEDPSPGVFVYSLEK